MTDVKPFTPQMWTDALRSGKYNQTKGKLHDPGGFCCLGVLCDLAVQAGVPVIVEGDASKGDTVTYDGSENLPPDSVVRWAGMYSHMPRVNEGKDYPYLDLLNDKGVSFEEIADIIEKHPADIFRAAKV